MITTLQICENEQSFKPNYLIIIHCFVLFFKNIRQQYIVMVCENRHYSIRAVCVATGSTR